MDDDTGLRVAALVDLYADENAGGHVKAWQRFAEAATHIPGDLDLTVYFLGDPPGTEPLSGTVRYRRLRPALGTRRLGLAQGAGHTDLARFHTALARELPAYDIIQATSVFAFARTAAALARRGGPPVLQALHTDVAAFARIYAPEVIGRFLPVPPLARAVTRAFSIPERSGQAMAAREAQLLKESAHVFAANPKDAERAAALVGSERVSLLRRGIDNTRFSPARRDRHWLAMETGLPETAFIALFAGRIDATKKALLAAQAVSELIGQGYDIHLVLAGCGQAEADIAALLGPRAHFVGQADQDRLARLMASSDAFLFPSETETIGNVAIEAKAAGLPILVAAGTAPCQAIAVPGRDGIVVDGTAGPTPAEAWAAALAPLIADPALRAGISAAARAHVEAAWPGWPEVVRADLLPVWRRIGGRPRQ